MSSYPISCRITRAGGAIHDPTRILLVKGLLFRTLLSSLCFSFTTRPRFIRKELSHESKASITSKDVSILPRYECCLLNAMLTLHFRLLEVGLMAIPLPDSRELPDEVLEALRMRALHGCELGFTEAEIADLLGVSRETVSRWYSAYTHGGLDALPHERTGRPLGSGRFLSEEQADPIKRLLR